MPNSTLPPDNYLGDPERTTGEFQDRINQLQNWVNALQAELQSLSGTTVREGAVRPVNGGSGPLRANLEPTDEVQFARITDAASPGDGDFDSDKLGYWEATINLSGSGSFTGGQINVKRLGRTVTIVSTSTLNHNYGSSAGSATDLLPTWAEETTTNQGYWNCYEFGQFGAKNVIITGRQLMIEHWLEAGTAGEANTAGNNINITYTV